MWGDGIWKHNSPYTHTMVWSPIDGRYRVGAGASSCSAGWQREGRWAHHTAQLHCLEYPRMSLFLSPSLQEACHWDWQLLGGDPVPLHGLAWSQQPLLLPLLPPRAPGGGHQGPNGHAGLVHARADINRLWSLPLLYCKVTPGTGSCWIVTQFHYTAWPGPSSPPSSPSSLLELLEEVFKVQQSTGNKTITVMCKSVLSLAPQAPGAHSCTGQGWWTVW